MQNSYIVIAKLKKFEIKIYNSDYLYVFDPLIKIMEFRKCLNSDYFHNNSNFTFVIRSLIPKIKFLFSNLKNKFFKKNVQVEVNFQNSEFNFEIQNVTP